MFDEMTATRIDIDGRPYWEWPDGRTAPVISGGDGDEGAGDAGDGGSFADAIDGGDGGGEGAPAGDAGAGDAGPGASGEPRMVPYDVYQRQIHENQQYRERYQPIERTFGRLDDDTRAAFAELAELYADDPMAAQRALAATFGIELPGQQEPEYATSDDVRNAIGDFFSQRDQYEATEAARGDLRSTAKELGFEPDSRDYRLLLDVAASEFGEDEYGQQRDVLDSLKAAAEAINADRKSQRDAWAKDYLAGKTDGVTNVSGGDAVGTEEVPKTMREARNAFSAALG